MRLFTSPFQIKMANVGSAYLAAELSLDHSIPVNHALTVVNGTGVNAGTATLTYTGAIETGVYTLFLRDMAGKCCYTATVHAKACPDVHTGPNGPTATYSGTGGRPTPIPSC